MLRPGGERCAGLSRRSIFYPFSDLAELYDAVLEALAGAADPALPA